MDDATQIITPMESDIRFYEQHGWWISGKLFTDEELDEIKDAAHRHQNGMRDVDLPIRLSDHVDWSPEMGERVRANDWIAYQNLQIRKIALKSRLGLIAARLARSHQIRVFNSSFVEKPISTSGEQFRVNWHTDKAFWGTCTSSNLLTAWIPMEEATTASGTVQFMDGSHKWLRTPVVSTLENEKHFISSSDTDFPSRATAAGLPVKIVSANVPRGHVSFHHCMLFHSSGPNLGSSPRGALVLHLQDEYNTYQPSLDANGQLVVLHLDELARRDRAGTPDYSDHGFCPVLWND